MLTLKHLDPDQIAAVDHIYENDATLLIAGMGAGKTILALTAAEELLMQHQIKRVLVLAPLKVCNKVWRGEHEQWEHTKDLNIGIATGDAFDDVIEESERYDIVVVNFDMLPKLADSGELVHFDGLVVDEATKLKSGGAWFKKLRHQIKNFRHRIVMTGTPVSENWHQLFYIMFMVDGGETFGKNRDKWLRKYFYPTDFLQRVWEVLPGQEEILAAMIEPFTHVVPDYTHTLPPLSVGEVQCPLPPSARSAYREMAGTFETQGILAQNAAVKSMKLTQIANGFIYDEDGATISIHDNKMQALDRILNSKPPNKCMSGKLVVYQFKAELEQLKKWYPEIAVMDRAGDLADDWNAGRLNIMAMHPKSGGHGMNLQAGGREMIWLSPPWSRDLLTQTIARLWRRGQTQPVDVSILVAPDTVDEVIMARQESKSAYMPLLLEHLAKVTSSEAA